MIAATADVATYRPPLGLSLGRVLRVFTSPLTNPETNIFKTIRRHRGPAILLEYLPDGSLKQLSRRAKETNRRFPNRLLWSFYFCSKRQQLLFTKATYNHRNILLIHFSGKGLRRDEFPTGCSGTWCTAGVRNDYAARTEWIRPQRYCAKKYYGRAARYTCPRT